MIEMDIPIIAIQMDPGTHARAMVEVYRARMAEEVDPDMRTLAFYWRIIDGWTIYAEKNKEIKYENSSSNYAARFDWEPSNPDGEPGLRMDDDSPSIPVPEDVHQAYPVDAIQSAVVGGSEFFLSGDSGIQQPAKRRVVGRVVSGGKRRR